MTVGIWKRDEYDLAFESKGWPYWFIDGSVFQMADRRVWELVFFKRVAVCFSVKAGRYLRMTFLENILIGSWKQAFRKPLEGFLGWIEK